MRPGMTNKLYIIALFIFIFQTLESHGQVAEKAIPLSVMENLPIVTEFTRLPPVDTALCDPGKLAQQNQFACPVYTDFDPRNSGQWIDTPKGKVWRLGIHSPQANSLYTVVRFSLVAGATLFVYGPGYQDFRGAFTSANNNPANVLSIAPVRGDRLIVEINLPAHLDSPGTLEMTKVYHGFRDIFNDKEVQRNASTRQGNCNEDINCANGLYWQTEKRSVCKIISNGGIGVGTLLANTRGSEVPYLISAHHLIPSAEVAAEALFLFNYETGACGGELSANTGSISGATLVSAAEGRLDYALMTLNELPPPSYQPFYAGWDATNTIPQQGTCIHHPLGGTKQVAIEYHPLVGEDIGFGFEANSTWKVSHWEVGTTEEGSSGAPLFDEHHRVVGTLTGGRSTCGHPRDDYFTKFGTAWDAYPQPVQQLSYWLDPDETGLRVLDGYDPYGFNDEYCDTAWNISASEPLGLSSAGADWGFLSGHSAAGYTQFAERFVPAGVLHVRGVYLHVAKAQEAAALANVKIKVWQGAHYPETESYSQLMFIDDLQEGEVHYVAFDTVLRKAEPFFVGYEIDYGAASDTFALYHAVGRRATAPSSTYVFDGSWHRSVDPDAFGVATSLAIGISECYGKSRNPAPGALNVFPNPCSNSVTIETPGGATLQDLRCFDSKGREVFVNLKQSEVDNKIHFNLRSGVYYLKIATSQGSYVERILVLDD